jgi:hypothetical protein
MLRHHVGPQYIKPRWLGAWPAGVITLFYRQGVFSIFLFSPRGLKLTALPNHLPITHKASP